MLIPIVTLLFTKTVYGEKIEAHKQLQQAIDEAHAGDVLIVKKGIYKGPIIIHKPIHLIAEPGAVVDGEGSEYVVTIRAPRVHVEGLTIRNSAYGKGAGVLIQKSSHVTLKHVRIEHVHYGVYVEKGTNINLLNNVIRGRDIHFAQRGNGIHLLKTSGVVVRENHISRVQDGIYLDWAKHTMIEKNEVTNARYAIHFMYAEDGMAKENVLAENINGMMMMSKQFTIGYNTIAKQLDYRGYGALIYDSEHVVMHNNTFRYNSTALSLQNARHCHVKDNDPYWVWEFKRLIRLEKEKEKGKAIIFSTHMLSIVEEIADTVVFIHQGQILIYDSVSALCQDGKSLESIFFAQISQHMSY